MITFKTFSKIFVKTTCVIILLLTSTRLSCINKKEPDLMSYYETAKLDIRVLNKVTGELNERGFLLNLNAFDRTFSAVLWPDKKVFENNVQVKIISKHKQDIKWSSENLIYEGQLKDEKESRVSGYFAQGKFNGQISVRHEDTFYIEPSQSCLNETQDTTAQVFIYRERDIIENSTSCSHTYSGILKMPYGDHVINQKQNKRHSTEYNSCPILVAVDSLFYQHVGRSSVETTLAKMAYHVSEADKIFRRTTFFEGQSTGLVIASLVVYKDQESEGIFSSPADIAIDTYLKSWSKLNHGIYCLSLLLTYRDFPRGVLGLAWLAELNTLGGICEPWNVHYSMSFNTALVTFINHGRMIGERAAILTIAHELGHAFGAQHDPTQCQPGGNIGNYLMYEHSSDTAHPNNDKFSQCSVKDMRRILEARAHQCFRDGRSYCGNGMVENGEQCDCGEVSFCHIRDPCCLAKDEENGIPGCILKSRALCSPKAGLCCSSDCKFINETQRKVCQEETECSFTSHCVNGSCPTAQQKPDNKICNNGSNVCKHGECKGSICLYYGRSECQCTDQGHLCHVCCNNSMGECVLSSQLTGRIVVHADKTPCGENMYCDEVGQCTQHVDTYYTPKDTLQIILGWMKRQWYVFMIIAIATTAKIMLFGYHGYQHWRVNRSRRREMQPGGLETSHTEYPSALQMEIDEQTL